MNRSGARIPVEALISLRARLSTLAARSAGRAEEIDRVAELYGVSPSSVYRQLRELHRPAQLQGSCHTVPN